MSRRTSSRKKTTPRHHDDLDGSPAPRPRGTAKKAKTRARSRSPIQEDPSYLSVMALLDSGIAPRIKTSEGRYEMTELKIDRDEPGEFDAFQANLELSLEDSGLIEDPAHHDGAFRHRLYVPQKTRDGKSYTLCGFNSDETFKMAVDAVPAAMTTIIIALRYVEKMKKRPRSQAHGSPPPAPKKSKTPPPHGTRTALLSAPAPAHAATAGRATPLWHLLTPQTALPQTRR